MRTIFSTLLISSFILAALSLPYDSCTKSRVCHAEGSVIQLCFNELTDSIAISSFTDDNELFTTGFVSLHEDLHVIDACPEFNGDSNNATIRYDSHEFTMMKAVLDENEVRIARLGYASMEHKSRFNDALETMKAQKAMLMKEIQQLGSKLGM